jgi:flagellar assembly protein FliH
LQQSKAAKGNNEPAHLEIFQYPDGPDPSSFPTWTGWDDPSAAAIDPEPGLPDPCQAEAEAAVRAELDRRLAEEGRRGFEAGREQGRQEGRNGEREAHAQAAAIAAQQRMQQAAELIDGFSRERDSFLLRVEHEVVELALAVAARILRREAQMDPLLLTGAVRVALGQLATTTAVKLRVPPAELDMWTEAMALIPNMALKPTVLPGEGMRMGDCSIETELGSVDLGIRAQLGEIERGFFDRTVSRREPPPLGSAHAGISGQNAAGASVVRPSDSRQV